MSWRRTIAMLCLLSCFLLLFTGCGEDDSSWYAGHQHKYLATHIAGTCVAYGYPEYRCHCGDSYRVFDDYLGYHSHEGVATVDLNKTYSDGGVQSRKCQWCGERIDIAATDPYTEPDLPFIPIK